MNENITRPDEIDGDYPDGYGLLTQYWNNGIVKVLHRTYDNGSWWKREYDKGGNQIYYEDSLGVISDDRQITYQDIINILNKHKELATIYYPTKLILQDKQIMNDHSMCEVVRSTNFDLVAKDILNIINK